MSSRTSTVSIFNQGLAILGGEQLSSVQAPWEDSTLGRLCLNLWPPVLDDALCAHPWSFALARELLAEKEEPRPRPGYPHRYALPADCLRPVGLTGGHHFVLEGRNLLTNAAVAELMFVRRVEDPSFFPPAFRQALVWGMGAALATAKNNDPRVRQECLQRSQSYLLEAVARDENSQQPAIETTPWELARFGHSRSETK